jgi:AraC-like DNA-binding protein
VDVLVDSLDDHAASSRAVASRVHLSRFHFDRLVSAAAGEPPATLRRRVLLERAAYRLITTDHDVLRMAVEAGYASNEAFTRAFAKAFGQAPSVWRRLDETFVDALCDPPEVFTYGGMIAHVLTFAAHRRTLVCAALADAGITDLGAGDPMKWVAEPA